MYALTHVCLECSSVTKGASQGGEASGSDPSQLDVAPWLQRSRAEEVAAQADRLLHDILGSTDAPDQPSIHAQLVARRARCRPDLGDWRALAPQPAVNQLLGSMVNILQGRALRSAELGLVTAIDRAMVRRIDRSTTLTQRARELRQISAEAEAEMERTYSRRWCELVRRDGVASLTDVVTHFPYHDGYRELVAAEVSLLSSPKRVIFGGGGPLPISGLLVASLTGAEVVVVDAEEQAVEQSLRLLHALEARALIPRAQVTVVRANVADMPLETPCDGIIVASLVNPEAKIQLARRVAEDASGPPLILRSAIGMCARTAYLAAPRTAVEAAGLNYRGELVPSNHVVSGLDPSVASRFDVRSERSHVIIQRLSTSVLNSAELYTA